MTALTEKSASVIGYSMILAPSSLRQASSLFLIPPSHLHEEKPLSMHYPHYTRRDRCILPWTNPVLWNTPDENRLPLMPINIISASGTPVWHGCRSLHTDEAETIGAFMHDVWTARVEFPAMLALAVISGAGKVSVMSHRRRICNIKLRAIDFRFLQLFYIILLILSEEFLTLHWTTEQLNCTWNIRSRTLNSGPYLV